MSGDVYHRRATEADLRFAEQTFLDALRPSFYVGPLAPWDRGEWYEQNIGAARRILRGPGVEVLVAAMRDVPAATKADIVGWLAFQRGRPVEVVGWEQIGPKHTVTVEPERRQNLPLVIFCYVKEHYRKWGHARKLFKRAGIDPWTDAYEYPARTEALTRDPASSSPHTAPMLSRMARARWNPRATRGGNPK